MVWSSAELAVTLICIGIPVCLPLYKCIYRRFRPNRRRAHGRNGGRSYEASLRPRGRGEKRNNVSQDPSNSSESSFAGTRITPTFTQLGARMGGSTTETYIGRGQSYSEANLVSDEETLADENPGGSRVNGSVEHGDTPRPPGIVVTRSYWVERHPWPTEALV
jgi:hypothetical protein